jgi:hypothetical protein
VSCSSPIGRLKGINPSHHGSKSASELLWVLALLTCGHSSYMGRIPRSWSSENTPRMCD